MFLAFGGCVARGPTLVTKEVQPVAAGESENRAGRGVRTGEAEPHETRVTRLAPPALPLLREGIPDVFGYLYHPIDPGKGSFRGVVREPDGAPAAGARVTVFRSDSWWKHSYAETVTDEEGRYAVEGIAEGGYIVTAVSPRGMVSWHGYLYSLAFLRQRMAELNLQNMLPRNLGGPDEGLHKTKNLELEAFSATSTSGRVVDTERNPVAGALIVTPGRPGLMETLTLNVRTDGEGRFRLPYPMEKDRKYTLIAYAGGYAPSSLDGVEPWSSDNEIVLAPPSHIAGTARLADTGEPVAGATVVLRAVHEHDPRITLVTNEAGRFAFPCLVAKKYQLLISEPGAGRASLEAPVLHLGETGSLDDLELLVSEGATIAGRAYVKETGEPLPGLRVTIPNLRTSDVFRKVETDADGRYRMSNLPAGKYAVQCSPAENVIRNFHYADQGPAGPYQQLELAAGEQRTDLDFVFEAGATVSGRVTDTEGNPVARARVSAKNNRRGGDGHGPDSLPLITSVVSTDAEGRYVLRGFSPSDSYTYRMIVSARGHGLLTSEPFKVTGDMTGKNFTLEAAAPVTGIVTNMAGTPLPLVSVGLEPADRSNPKPRPQGALSGVDGRFSFAEGAFPGTYHIGVNGWFNQDLDVPWNGHAMVRPLVVEDAAPVTGLRVVVPSRAECGVLSGRVYEHNTSHAIEGARVAVSRLEANGETYGLYGGDFQAGAMPGAFTLGYVYPGTATLTAWAEGYPRQEVMTLPVTPGMKRDNLSLFLKGERAMRAVIEGVVTVDGEVDPPTQRILWLRSPDVQVRNSQFGVDEQGAYRIENLEPGRYFLTVLSREWTPDEVLRWNRQGAVDIAAEAGMIYTCDFELGGTGTLTGTVSVPEGASDVRIYLRAAGTPGPFPDRSAEYEEYCRQVVAYATHVSPEGVYLIRRVPPGAYEALFTCIMHLDTGDEERLVAVRQIGIAPDKETTIDMTF